MSATQKPSVAAVLSGDDVGASVIDVGSYHVRVGAAGDDAPRALLHPAIGLQGRIAGDRLLLTPFAFSDISSVHSYDHATGSATVADWDAMQAVWAAGGVAARVDLSAAPLMLVEPSRSWADEDRAAALERAFEGLAAPAVFLARGAAMAAFAAARTTACVVDVGEQGATAVPVLDGYVLRRTAVSGRVGGRALSENLYQLAEEQVRAAAAEAEVDARFAQRPDSSIGSKGSRLRAMHEVKRKRRPHVPAMGPGSLPDPLKRRFDIEDLACKEPLSSCTDQHRAFYRLRLLDDVKATALRVSPDVPESPKQQSNGNGDAMDVGNGDAMDVDNDDGGGNGSIGNGNGESGDRSATENGAVASANKVEKDAKDADREKEREREIEKSKDKERSPSFVTTYELPDGNLIDVSKPSASYTGYANVADALFDNGTADDPTRHAISNMVFDAISACDIDMRRELYAGIVLTGGSSLIPGTVERFTRELAVLTPQLFKMKIIAAQNTIERTAGPWIGGSIVASLGTFHQAWISKAEYDELGATGSLRKCP
jgi:actin-related protein 4